MQRTIRLKPKGFRELTEAELEAVAGGLSDPPSQNAYPGVNLGADGTPVFDAGGSTADYIAERDIEEKFQKEDGPKIDIQFTIAESGHVMRGEMTGGKQYYDRDGNGSMDLIWSTPPGGAIFFDNGDGQGMRAWWPGTEPWNDLSNTHDPINVGA